MEDVEAAKIYSVFTISVILSQFIGAIVGDLLIGNKKAIITGMLLQACGAFCINLPYKEAFFISLFLIAIGGGLYSPNLISSFGKLYYDKTKLLDSGLTILYLIPKAGSFIAPLAIGFIGIKFGWQPGFITCGIIALLSLILFLTIKIERNEKVVSQQPSINNRTVNIVIIFILVGLFWVIYGIASFQSNYILNQFNQITTIFSFEELWSTGSLLLTIPLSIIAIFLWKKFYSRPFFKLMTGAILVMISFGLLYMIPEYPNELHFLFYGISVICLNVSQIYIAPVLHSVIFQYSKPKFFTILISFASIPTSLLSIIVTYFGSDLYESTSTQILIGLTAITGLSVGIIYIYLLRNRNQKSQIEYL
ncbi:peptide MFS transporter [Flammeovirgaceae bacterium KN852]|uniref:Peptide MFS transporter n=2 Tax=Marinigracilibium pacificum TaxID=2729599 RepID=A0A848IZL7_9BACT|nr:MFS transporter [Marinigracilibium pacificum]NMM47664.1 peptide MFS transporter [Marinigracilibium pacificum]